MNHPHHSLQRDAMGLAHSVIMGIGGTAPTFSMSASAATLIAAVGILAPATVLYCGLVMFGITFAFTYLNKVDPSAGASFAWVSRIFNPTLGYLTGWTVMVTAVLFMASATVPAASATLLLLAPDLVDNQIVVTLLALAWLLLVIGITVRGTAVAARVQTVFIGTEVLVLTAIGIAAFMQLGSGSARSIGWEHFAPSQFDAATFASGAMISLFLFWGWDVTLNLSEETKSGHKSSSWGAALAMISLMIIFVVIHAAVLLALDDEQIKTAGTNLLFAVADKLLPKPWSYLALLIVMLSTIGALASSTLSFSRTLFAKSRHGVSHPRWSRLHPKWKTPHFATFLFAGLGTALLLLSLVAQDIGEVLRISITAIGLQTAFYYGLTGFACAWSYRHEAKKSMTTLVLAVLWPLASALTMWVAAFLLMRDFDLLTSCLGVGGILLGLVPFYLQRARVAGNTQIQ
ncbi:MAG: APC family permease [Burkholderiales bacterium]